jgi:hypothetical protein
MSSYEAQIGNPCMRCETVRQSIRNSEHAKITRTQPVSQPRHGALHLITRVPSSFSCAVISVSHSHSHQPGFFFGLVQRFVGQCCCPQIRVHWFPSPSAALDRVPLAAVSALYLPGVLVLQVVGQLLTSLSWAISLACSLASLWGVEESRMVF